MKKLFVFVFFFMVYSNFYGQVFKVGVIAGLNGSQVEGDGYGGYHKLGFIAGGFTNMDLSEKFSTQLEMYFINKGSQKNPNTSQGDYDQFYLNINYIEIPLVLRYQYKKFMFEAGLYYSKFLSYYMYDEYGELFAEPFPFKSYDFGGLYGLNYKLNDHFIFNLRAKNGILPIRDFQNYDQQIGILNKWFKRGWYNLELNFSIRYQFNK